MLTFNELTEKKSKIKINPNKNDLMEDPKKKHGEDCTCKICETRREKDEGDDGPTCECVDFTEEWIDSAVEVAADYFYSEGLNEEGLEQLIEEVGIDEFTEFVIDPIEELNEERSARKASVKAPSYEKVKAKVDASDKAKKASGKGEYAKSYAKRSGETEDSTNYGDSKKPAAKKKAATPKKKAAPKTEVKPVAKATVRKPKAAPAKKAATSKKVAATVTKAKAKQPVKPTSKPGILGRVRTAVKKGVERHNKARAAGREPEKRVKEFAKGVKSGVKASVKFAKDVKKVVSKEEAMMNHLKSRLVAEATRLKKEKGYDKGGTKSKKDPALAAVLDRIRKDHGHGAVVGQGGSRQAKKVKGAKSDAGTGKYKKAADAKKAYAFKAKKAGFKSTKDYTNTMARYGGESNYKKGKGLGT
tara:strand:- start:1344 stop:2591 length:1248 start_codon:yes stop_codon:yes gene_type:complete